MQMARKRIVAFFMVIVTILFVIACIPAVAEENKPCAENPLPISLASPAREIMYFLPSYDEAVSFTPVKKLYDLPASFEIQEVRENLNSFSFEDGFGQAVDLYCIESISPRAP